MTSEKSRAEDNSKMAGTFREELSTIKAGAFGYLERSPLFQHLQFFRPLQYR